MAPEEPGAGAGHFQTLEYPSDDTIIIHDQIYGDHTITEAVLVALLKSPSVIRLSRVGQHGITSFVGLTPNVTRFEHSVGAMLVVRLVGGSVPEQIVGLLHDISHTAFSHVIDWAMTEPGEPSFHEAQKMRFVATTELPGLLTEHGFQVEGEGSVFDEESFPLVEMPAPHLCADRFDYGIRDAVAFGKIKLADARRIVSSLRVHPDAESPKRLLVLEDIAVAHTLAKGYMAADREVWGNPAHGLMYQQTGEVIGNAVRRGVIPEEQLWKLSDAEFWEALREAADADGKEVMARLERDGLPSEEGLKLLPMCKIRTIDPDIRQGKPGQGEAFPLSLVYPRWMDERLEYIAERNALRA